MPDASLKLKLGHGGPGHCLQNYNVYNQFYYITIIEPCITGPFNYLIHDFVIIIVWLEVVSDRQFTFCFDCGITLALSASDSWGIYEWLLTVQVQCLSGDLVFQVIKYLWLESKF